MFFDPFVQSQKALELWTKATQEQLARMAEMGKHFDLLGEQHTQRATERTRDAIDESARLMKASFDYATSLGGELRKVSVDLANQFVAAGTATAPKA